MCLGVAGKGEFWRVVDADISLCGDGERAVCGVRLVGD